MAQSIRPRRSVLYMPGSNARALEKGRTLPADALILDCEDAVAPDAKLEARKNVVEACRAARDSGAYGKRELLFRTNALSSPWGRDDLIAAASSGAHGVLLPKVESATHVRDADALLAETGAPADLAIWCMMEAPRGILKAEEIALASPRMAGFVMGTSDLTKDLHAEHTTMRLPMIVSLGTCLLAARAYGLSCIDGVYLDLNDDAGFEVSCRQGRELGFDGKTLIHPKTVDACNRVFAPSEGEIATARKLIAAFDEARAAGKGVVVVDGKLVENLHVANAQRLVALAEAIAAA